MSRMSMNPALTVQLWKVRYSYAATDGRPEFTSLLSGGQKPLNPEEAAARVARAFRHEGPIEDVAVWQETPDERDARLDFYRRSEAEENKSGAWWGMGGAN
ncbi:hypothetical protein [Streptomyces milbemycinicus]|uniref:hypothetical protein n=1 Tax=Streptomyces milbemycinicus TaxID=476552 RepID=UPI000A3AF086|nr:hypothetical protein [Streptomyces milbemycinicus]